MWFLCYSIPWYSQRLRQMFACSNSKVQLYTQLLDVIMYKHELYGEGFCCLPGF